MAEKEGFEPSRPFRGLHDFQSCALDQLGDFSIAVPVQKKMKCLLLKNNSIIIITEDFTKSSAILGNILFKGQNFRKGEQKRGVRPDWHHPSALKRL